MTPQDRQLFGEAGNLTVSAGVQVNGEFCRIQCIGSTTFTTLTDTLEKTTAVYGTAATGTLTFTDAPTADETIAVNGTTYTFKATAAGATEITIGTGGSAGAKAAATAANVATVVSANDTAVVVTSAAGVATITAAAKGTGGNSIALAETCGVCTKSGTALAGGANLTAASSLTYADGTTLYGMFTVVKPASGAVRCTLASPRA